MVCAPILPSVPFNCYKHIANKFGQLSCFVSAVRSESYFCGFPLQETTPRDDL
jgi:hypothetical protein